ncbi:MAG: hypothetical protein LBQ52_02470 [Helicobacteraceae bacterium]|nr:hypothetical protein [Helicobacteraceae bacterium]
MKGGFFQAALYSLLRIAFVGVSLNGKKANLTIRVYQNKRLIKEEKLEFEAPNGAPSAMMFEYLQKLEKRNAYVYIATILASINQGALPSCDSDFFHKMRIDTDNILTVNIDNRWSIYASVFDVEEIQRKYISIDGIDYIFPTEALIDFARRRMKISIDRRGAFAFLLYGKASATLAIYQDDLLVYSSHIIFDDDDSAETNPQNDISDIFDDALTSDAIGDEAAQADAISDDFNTIEDLDAYMDSMTSSDSSDLNNAILPQIDENPLNAPELDFNEDIQQSNIRRDMLLFNFLKNSFNVFYKNENYDSDFINHTAILEAREGAKSAAEFLRKELCIDATIYPIDVGATICDMAYEEAKS